MITNKIMQRFPLHYFIISALLILLLTSCSDESKESAEANQPLIKEISLSDWDGIKKNRTLRIITPFNSQHNEYLRTKSINYTNELKFIVNFCEANNLTPWLIPIRDFSALLPALEEGLGDVVAANLTITENRKKNINFTFPVFHSIEQLIVAKSSNKKLTLKKLFNLNKPMKIGVRKHTSFWDTITEIKSKQKKEQETLHIVELNKRITTDERLNKVVSGELDAVVEDSNSLIRITEYRQDIKVAFDLGKERPIAWGVRKNNPELLKRLNQYIKTEKLRQRLPEIRFGDLDTIKKNKQLRLITRNNASTYFLWKNQLMGFEYDLIKEFAKQQKVSLEILVADDLKQMIEWLDSGYGDIISAGLIKTLERKKLPILFSEPYLFVKEIIVQRKGEKAIKSYEDLDKRTFFVRKSSSYWNTLNSFQSQLKILGINFSIEFVPENMETEEIIAMVLNRSYDLTLADSHIIDIERSWQNNIQPSLPLTGTHGQRWLVRKESKKLVKALNKFIKKQYKSLFYNVTYNKYFNNSRSLFDETTRKDHEKQISPYDDLIKSLSKEYNFDWRLIAAQINKESRFNPKAKSWAGARGLLQVMPRTAKEVGISNLYKPENGLRAGLKYMAWINEQLSDELPADVQVWFTLAAYNAGLGHLRDARNLARKQGLNPDRWFGHVEKAFLLLSKPKHHKKSRYGYVRGIEPVTYIKKIQAVYELYSIKHPQET